ncbi:carboxypeptidase C (cathepsin A) [Zymomonas mobilis]|uniref:S10 family peptidase n=1 Tax=Zymomonas mobilis TaxID=542 RepID=UPI000B3AA70C|nr:peptidase S10 [Zymomonas mobilis]ART92823.1 peptidase S10 [Zymomonas mobilis subsp. mobilis]TWD59481.1 carboxypeptidase C (cathepsin A) [Zymomonas mobilis]
MRFSLLVTSLLFSASTLAAPAMADHSHKKDFDKKVENKEQNPVPTDDIQSNWAKPPVAEQEKTTEHSVSLNGKELHYKATAGTLTIRDDNGKPTASVFYTAYTLDTKNLATKNRPVTFFYNGGPGSSSLWLHVGSFAPVKVNTTDPVTIRPAPYSFGVNPDSMLDISDLVFIDAVGAGYSRPLGDTKGAAFWGVDQDARAFAKTIERYVNKNQRWSSPKYLFGESYGTTRSGQLVNLLQNDGMQFNGVVLLSSILNYGIRQAGYDHIYKAYLPSYAATAWYHNKLANRPADLKSFLDQARAFAAGDYAAALEKGDLISDAEKNRVAQQMSIFTGLSPEFIKLNNLRVELGSFRKELLRDRHLTTGRLDARYTGIDTEPAGESPEYDASGSAVSGAFYALFRDYLGRDLGYQSDLDYRISIYGQPGFNWDWKHKAPTGYFPQEMPDVAVDLSAAMRENPHLKILSLNGYYDMATPFFATEYDLSHMMLEPAQRTNISYRYYPSGHMVYLDPASLHQMKKDIAVFYDQTTTKE